MSRVFKIKDSWYLDYKDKTGKRIRKTAKTTNKKVALLKLKEKETENAESEILGIVKPEKILFETFAKKYLENAKSKALSTYRTDRNRMNGNLIPFFKGKYLNQINVESIDQFKALRSDKVKKSTVNRDLSLLKGLFSKAVDYGYLLVNPAKKVKQFKEPLGRTRFLTKQEIKDLLNECDVILKDLVIVALATGCRKGELENLKWCDIDIINRFITLTHTKNNQVRNIRFGDDLLEVFNRLPKNNEYVFGKIKNQRKLFDKAVKRANLTGVTFHTLRHTAASYLTMSGVDLRTIAEILGHKTLDMVMRYSHLAPEHQKEAINKLSAMLFDHGKNLAKTEIDPDIDISDTSDKILKNNNVERMRL